MRPTLAQHNLLRTVIHWILALLILVLIGLGWYLQYLPQAAPEREFFISLHVSLGLTSMILIGFKILLWLIFGSSSSSETIPHWHETVIQNLYILIYVCVIILGISGFLWAIASATSVKFWGLPVPTWGAGNLNLNGFYGALHEITALILTALVIIQVGILFFRSYQQKKFAYNRSSERSQQLNRQVTSEIAPPTLSNNRPPKKPQQPNRQVGTSEIAPPTLAKAILRLVKNLHRLGWIAFWVQFTLAIISLLLLLFATSGQVISPNVGRLSSGIFWAIFGFAILCLTTILFFYYTRSARKINAKPDFYINPKKKSSPWFLKLSYKASLIGMLIGFIGVGISISLLIAKTISQPPGIAITDPRKIVRALDVFILLINFDLLIAHFIGAVISIWVTILASRARTLTTSPASFSSLPLLQE
jgi:cytochrome b561